MIITLRAYKNTYRGVGSVKAEAIATFAISEKNSEGFYLASISFANLKDYEWALIRLNALESAQSMCDGKGYYLDVSEVEDNVLRLETTRQGIIDSLYLFTASEPVKKSANEGIDSFQRQFPVQQKDDTCVEISLHQMQK